MASLDLPTDIMRLIIAADPAVFFYVSHGARELAAAAVRDTASITILGNVFYQDVIVVVRADKHNYKYHDISAANHYDINPRPWTPCNCCGGADRHSRKVYKWVSRPPGGVRDLDMNVLRILIIMAAAGKRKLPAWF